MASEGLDGGDGQLRLWDTIFEKCWLERYSTYGSNLWRDATFDSIGGSVRDLGLAEGDFGTVHYLVEGNIDRRSVGFLTSDQFVNLSVVVDN